MTRWADGDLAGRTIEHYKVENKRVKHVLMEALKPDGIMLCDEILSRKSYESKALGLVHKYNVIPVRREWKNNQTNSLNLSSICFKFSGGRTSLSSGCSMMTFFK